MSNADTSYTARLNHLRSRTQAIFRVRNPDVREFGPGGDPTPESIRQSRALGQITQTLVAASGTPATITPCCPASPACEPVCPVSTIPPVPDGFSLDFLNSNTPFIGVFDLSGEDIGFPISFVEFILSEIYGPTTITIPDGYPFEAAIFLAFPPYCNATSNSVTLTVSGDVVPFQSVQYGPSPFPDSIYGPQGIGGTYVIFPSVDLTLYDPETILVSLTVSNSCSSESGDASTDIFCFLAGSPVALADGTTKPIETVAVGDRVIGAFGEINTVTGSLSNNLGFVPVTDINGEHKTTAPHPHIRSDYKFCCANPTSLKLAYGRSFPLKGADGSIEARVIKGVKPERITKLEVGTVLQTLTGARTVTTLETIRMPPSTRVYHLTTDGSHSYTVDGYAVAGGATEDDFNYDTWTPRT